MSSVMEIKDICIPRVTYLGALRCVTVHLNRNTNVQTINMLLEKSKTWPNMMFSISTRPLLMLTSKTWQYCTVSEKQ